MKLLTKDQLDKLNTKRLLAYKNKLLSVRESYCWCDCTYEKVDGVKCLNKEHPTWQDIYELVKKILSTREHVARK